MTQAILDFENNVIERMSRSYYDELLYFTATVPNPLINFNDVLLLKKGQKYVSHTNTLFQKSIATLFSALYNEHHIPNSICKTDGGKGRGIYIKSQKMRLHFLSQEKFVNFPRVNWLNLKDGANDCFDLYTVTIQKDEQGVSFISQANGLLKKENIKSKEFILLEDYVIQNFGHETWNELGKTFMRIEAKTKKYQWFGLINYYNELTQAKHIETVMKRIVSFDFRSKLLSPPLMVDKRDFDILEEEFIVKEKYKILFSDNDFAKSFTTAEWLFDNLNFNDLLEKTFLVTGYIKSIEQLMFYFIRESASESDQIGILASSGIVNVDVQSKDFYKATLGNMLHYMKLYSNRHIFVSELSNTAINKTIEIVRAWIQEERNGYFHKHNIQTQEIVTEIREKTFVLYFLIISSINICE